MTIPMKDGKVVWPKGIGTKVERLEWIEREYAKRCAEIKALQTLMIAIGKVAESEPTLSEPARKLIIDSVAAVDETVGTICTEWSR